MARPFQLSFREIRERYLEKGRAFPAALEQQLREDGRPGALAILETLARRRKRNRAEGQRLRHLLRYERERWGTGVRFVAGVDEVGMSPLAGPVAAGAVILPPEFRLVGIDDSKRLDGPTREEFARQIREKAVAFAVGWVEPSVIDRINIYHAGLLAMQRAVQALPVSPEELLVDARVVPEVEMPQLRLVKGDERSMSIAAASIVAKVARDAHMCHLDRIYPGYGFARHKGYPVREHREALRSLGVLPIHRRSFAPVRETLALEANSSSEDPTPRAD